MVAIALGALLQMASASQADDAALLREARRAQSLFESVRRANLPRETADPVQRCHATVGRMCYWSDGEEAKPPGEPARIIAARERLIEFLDSAVAVQPANPWLHGQRTRYLLEAGRAGEAAGHARRCRAERWWCAALEGLSLHVAESYGESDSVFSLALAAMPAAQRCEWTDLREMVGGALSRELARASCADRAAMAARLWTLGKPLWTTPGNDLRTEHLARHTMARIQAESAITHDMRFGDDNRELIVRYGWSEWFTRETPRPGLATTSGVRVTGHSREPNFAFFPDVPSVKTLPRLSAASWNFRDSLARGRYAPRHVKRATSLDHQLARLLRGDSMEIAVAYRVADTAMIADSLESHLVVLHEGALRSRQGTLPPGGLERRGSARLVVPRDTSIASVEVHGKRSKRMSRARYTVDPIECSRSCLSDLVLFDAEAHSDQVSLEAAMSDAVTGSRFSVRRPLGVYWELYGERTQPRRGAEFSVLVTPANIGRVRRIATRLGLAREQSPIRLRWSATPTAPTDVRSVVLRLPRAARGTYRVVVTVESSDGTSIASAREIELVP